MPNQFLRDDITVNILDLCWTRRVTISTADVNAVVHVPETCLFFGRGSSKVVESYATWEDAIEGHQRWVNNPERVVQAIRDHLADPDPIDEDD